VKSLLEGYACDFEKSTSPIEVRLNVVATVRQLLQQCSYSMIEWLSTRKIDATGLPSEELLGSLRQPTDGTLVDAVEELLYLCERAGWLGIAAIPAKFLDKSCPAKSLCTDQPQNIDGLLRSIVEMRNDGAEGHGLPGGYNPAAEISALRELIDAFSPVLPIRDASNGLLAGPPSDQVRLDLLRIWNGEPVLIRKLRNAAGRRLRVEAQARVGPNQRDTVTYETADFFSQLAGHQPPAFSLLSGSSGDWTPWYYLPDRLTDAFSGRKDELGKLQEWLDDSDSRVCLVYGDGGLGKTTLVVEILHRWLEGGFNSVWRPSFISFYTAKRWRWGLDGLEVAKSGRPHMLDLISQLHCLFFDKYPDQSWYKLSLSQAAQRLAGELQSVHKTTRDDQLIVIDNAETLINSEQDRDRLARELKEVSKRLGKVIITSRRREYVEASPVEVRPLSPRDGVNFLKRRGVDTLKIPALKRAKDPELLDCVRALACRPLVLDVFIRIISDPSSNTLQKAQDRVNKMLAKDLGDFLFDDAWQRLEPRLRNLLLIMVRVADVHDSVSLRFCCAPIGVSVGLAEAALEESAGIASVSRIGADIQIEFSPNFIKFAESKTDVGPDGAIIPDQSLVDRIKSEYADYLRNARRFVGDRLPQAYQHPAAKAARTAAADGKLTDARKFYGQALLSDSRNGWLYDRYADFLFRRCRDLSGALLNAIRATEILPDQGEIWFTRGMIEARLGMRVEFESSLKKAEKFGVPRLRCVIQMAWGYVDTTPPQPALARQQLELARLLNREDRYFDRNRIEIERIEARLSYVNRP
jgi:tetratricopeptide (TPR) repeat protein